MHVVKCSAVAFCVQKDINNLKSKSGTRYCSRVKGDSKIILHRLKVVWTTLWRTQIIFKKWQTHRFLRKVPKDHTVMGPQSNWVKYHFFDFFKIRNKMTPLTPGLGVFQPVVHQGVVSMDQCGMQTWVVACDTCGAPKGLPQQRGVLLAVLHEDLLQRLRPVQLVQNDRS